MALKTLVLVDAAGHRHERQDAVHVGVVVELVDEGEDFFLAGAVGQRAVVVVEADRAGVLLDLAAVELRAAVVAHQDGGDAGLHAAGRQLGDLGLDLFAYLVGDRLAVDDLSCHGVPLVSRRGLVRAWRA